MDRPMKLEMMPGGGMSGGEAIRKLKWTETSHFAVAALLMTTAVESADYPGLLSDHIARTPGLEPSGCSSKNFSGHTVTNIV